MYFNQIEEKRRTAIYVSRLERKPTNLLRDLEKFQSLGVYAWFSKQNLWVRGSFEMPRKNADTGYYPLFLTDISFFEK